LVLTLVRPGQIDYCIEQVFDTRMEVQVPLDLQVCAESPVERAVVRELVDRAFAPYEPAPAPEPEAAPEPDPAADDAAWLPPLYRPVDHTPPVLDPAAARLAASVDELLAQDPSALPEAVAEQRAVSVLEQVERLTAVTADAIADVEDRELFTRGATGSTRAWLRSRTCGDGGQLTRSRRFRRYRGVRNAVAAGTIGDSAATTVTAELDRLPESVEEHQVEGVLRNALPDLLRTWAGRHAMADAPTPQERANAALLEKTIDDGLAAVGTPAERLEPAFVLLAQALTPSHLSGALRQVLDALAPDSVEEESETAYQQRSARLVKKRFTPGFRLEVDLTDEDGARLQARLDAGLESEDAVAEQLAALVDEAAESGAEPGDDHPSEEADPGDQAEPDVGSAGPGRPPEDEAHPLDALGPPPDRPVEGDGRTKAQRLYDVLVGILEAGAGPTWHSPPPAGLLVTSSVEALEGRAGVLPGTLLTRDGPITLPAAAVQRLGCDGKLSAVLLDAAGRPVGASHTRRHATARERRALRAQWGDYCATNGCGRLWTIPHHVEPYWLSGRTVLKDLIGVCTGCHHDVHDGHRVLRLRDGRLIDELGWVEQK
jgi:hypothetical protein